MVPKDGIILGEGKHHTVYVGDAGDQVIKIPKKECPVTYKRACKSLQFFRKKFPDFIPETDIFLGENDIPYYVVQRRVRGILLGEFLQQNGMPEELKEKLLLFMGRAMRVFNINSVSFDIIGTPPSDNLRNRWDGCTNIIIEDGEDRPLFVDLCCQSRSIERHIVINWLIRLAKHRLYSTIKNERLSLFNELQGGKIILG